jgi:hypothetical protein
MSDLSKLSIFEKLMMSTFQWNKSCIILNSGYKTAGFRIGAAGEVSLLAVRFPVLILSNSGILSTSRKNLLLDKLLIFEKLLSFWKLMEWIEKTLRTKAASKWVSLCPKYLVNFTKVPFRYLDLDLDLDFKSIDLKCLDFKSIDFKISCLVLFCTKEDLKFRILKSRLRLDT